MNRPDAVDQIAERLREVARIASNTAVSDQAQRLISRLNSPVRVVLLGLPDAGKLGLLNALAAGPALPESAEGVTVELRYGRVEAAEITYSDGAVVQHDGALDADTLAGAAMVVVERPFPVLRRTSVLNLVASSDPREQEAAISWASRRTDIALWCSARFGAKDRLIWHGVPDRIRDHGYLVLTGCGAEEAAAIKAQHRDDFVDVYTVDLSGAPGSDAETGVGELADRIAYHAELGRRADKDSALMFLKAHEPRERTRPRTVSRPVSKPGGPRPLTRPRTRPRTQSRPLAPAPEAWAAAPAMHARPVPKSLYGAGFGYLRDRGQALLRSSQDADDSAILSHCSATLTQLSDLIAGHEDAAEAGELADAVMEAESLVILLENERGTEAAIDAVSILLQIRREFEAGLAA